MDHKEKAEQFLTKLDALMKEYNADIHFTCEGDTYGIYKDRIVIDVDGKSVHENSGYWLERE